MESTYKNALIQLIEFLDNLEEREGIKYFLVGGILANLYSDFRITRDIDLVIDFSSSNITMVDYINLLKENDFKPYQDWSSTLYLARESNIIQFLDKTDTVKYDNHIIDKFRKDKYKKIGPISLQRRIRERIFEIECWVTSKEDFIISKLVYGGWQDYTDALGCWLRFKEDLDIKYIDKNSKDLGILREWNLLKSGIVDPDEYFEQLNGY